MKLPVFTCLRSYERGWLGGDAHATIARMLPVVAPYEIEGG